MMYDCKFLDKQALNLLRKGLFSAFNLLREKNLQWKVDFSKQNLRGVSFGYANLEGVNFQGADMRMSCLSRVNMHGCNFKGVNFTHANLFGADIRGALIDSETIFTDANVVNVRANDIEEIIERAGKSASYVRKRMEFL